MARMNVTLPDELATRVHRTLPGLNVSGVLQAALAERLDCEHDFLECEWCRMKFDRYELNGALLEAFYKDALWRMGELAYEAGTAEGACRIFKTVGTGWGIRAAHDAPLPRPSRAARRAALEAKVAELPSPQKRRARVDETA